MKHQIFWMLTVVFMAGCAPSPKDIPGIDKNHPANQFYFRAYSFMVNDKFCKDCHGATHIPMGEIPKGEKYTKIADLAPGVFRFLEKATGKTYLGVSYLKWEGFLQFPKLCVWEEKK